MLGDLNEVLKPTEVSGGGFSIARANLFGQMLDHWGFIDLHTVGGVFTWRKNVQRGGHVRKRLDRVVADIDWRLSFPHALVELLPLHGSDHNPLLMSCKKSQSNRVKLFHFQAAWLTHPEYEPLVKDSWCEDDGAIQVKLGRVKERSILFNKHVFGNIF